MTLAEATKEIEGLGDRQTTICRIILILIYGLQDAEPDLVDRTNARLEALGPLSGESDKELLEEMVSQLKELES